MPFAIGIVLALLTGLLLRLVSFDRDRAVYPVLVIVIALYYVLFAAVGGSGRTIMAESVITILFAGIAIVGFRVNMWVVVAALAGHGVMDLIHHRLVANPGVPAWWPAFCMAYDVLLACILAWLLQRGTIPTRGVEPASRSGAR